MQTGFQYNDTLISYTITGKGHPVILLHGFGEDSDIWKDQAADLSQYCQLILPDLPGSGQSQLLHSSGNEIITMNDYAEVLFALLNHLKIDKATVLGHSMGGYITLAFAEKYPGTLTGFGLLHSTAFADSPEKKEARKKGIEIIQQYGAYTFLKNTIPNLFSVASKKSSPENVATLIEKGKNFTTEALIQYYNAMIDRPDRTAVLAESKVPVLFIIGSEDVAAPLNDLLEQVHLPKVSYMHILKDVGHMGMYEATEQFNRHIVRFIQEVAGTY